MKTLHLYGYMKDKYGGSFDLDVSTPAEAVRALSVQLPGFGEDIRQGNWHVLRGPLDDQEALDGEGVLVALGHDHEVHLLPAVEGANNGALMTVVGVVLFVAGFFTGGTTWAAWGPAMMAMGAGMAVGGIVTMTMKLPTGTDPTVGDNVDQRASFLFNGPTNTSSQGVAVPRGYGRLRVGSIVISASVQAEELSA